MINKMPDISRALLNNSGEFNSFINNRLKEPDMPFGYSNCFGTGFYLTGEQEADIPITSTKKINRFIKELKLTNQVQVGYLIYWSIEKKDIWSKSIKHEPYHIGIISSVNPFLIIHRPNKNAMIKIDDHFKDVNKYYQKKEFNIKYYVPRRLN